MLLARARVKEEEAGLREVASRLEDASSEGAPDREVALLRLEVPTQGGQSVNE